MPRRARRLVGSTIAQMTQARFIDGPTQIRLFERHFDEFLAVLRAAVIADEEPPARTHHEFPVPKSRHGETHLRLVYTASDHDGTIGLKILSYPLPRDKRPSMMQGITVVFGEDGAILGVLDARTLTSLRTACVTALAAKALARATVQRIGVVGFGLQGRAHASVLMRMYPLATVHVHDQRPDALADYQTVHAEASMIRPAESAFEAAHLADVLVTTTTSSTPFVQKEWLSPGVLYCQIGREDECTQEAILSFDRLIADDWGKIDAEGSKSLARAHRAGRLVKPVTDLRDIFNGRNPGRTSPDERIMLTCTGLPAEDIATARFIAERAATDGLGIPIDLLHTAF